MIVDLLLGGSSPMPEPQKHPSGMSQRCKAFIRIAAIAMMHGSRNAARTESWHENC
jgi:hypothetical protein